MINSCQWHLSLCRFSHISVVQTQYEHWTYYTHCIEEALKLNICICSINEVCSWLCTLPYIWCNQLCCKEKIHILSFVSILPYFVYAKIKATTNFVKYFELWTPNVVTKIICLRPRGGLTWGAISVEECFSHVSWRFFLLGLYIEQL